MRTLEYRTIDKSSWGPGPWQEEPDKRQWQDEATGLPCLIVRGPVGALCGYVGLPEGHKLFGQGYNEASSVIAEGPHGGLTFAGACSPAEKPEHGICYLAEPGEPEVWWFGFDCAHSGDECPGMSYRSSFIGQGTYRDFAYVTAECAALARELKGAEGPQELGS